MPKKLTITVSDEVYEIVRPRLIEQAVVFAG
jgi:hypothetical protein